MPEYRVTWVGTVRAVDPSGHGRPFYTERVPVRGVFTVKLDDDVQARMLGRHQTMDGDGDPLAMDRDFVSGDIWAIDGATMPDEWEWHEGIVLTVERQVAWEPLAIDA